MPSLTSSGEEVKTITGRLCNPGVALLGVRWRPIPPIPGYWAQNIGYYGGINYGHGYVGRGYYGGYWRGGNFDYNRSVTNVNTTIVRSVYNCTITNNQIVNNTRISYNGGSGGVRVAPIPAELAVSRERRVAAVPAQIQQARQAAVQRSQFAQDAERRLLMMVGLTPKAFTC